MRSLPFVFAAILSACGVQPDSKPEIMTTLSYDAGTDDSAVGSANDSAMSADAAGAIDASTPQISDGEADVWQPESGYNMTRDAVSDAIRSQDAGGDVAARDSGPAYDSGGPGDATTSACGVCVNDATSLKQCDPTTGMCMIQRCLGGTTPYAGTGYLDCDRSPLNGCEVDSRHDPNNCGSCKRKCVDNFICNDGTCVDPCWQYGYYSCG